MAQCPQCSSTNPYQARFCQNLRKKTCAHLPPPQHRLLALSHLKSISKVRYYAIRVFVLLTVISVLPLLPVQASPGSPNLGPELQSALSDRYVIFIDGVDSYNTGVTPLKNFEFIKNELIKAGLDNKHFVYFSYSATAQTNYCLGWINACTPTQDLSYINLFPAYGVIHTHLKITHQAETLKWLIGQIVKKDASAQIDIIGFSQGGIIAAYLGSKLDSSSPLYPHIHGIITIESPLGGIPGASPCLDNPDSQALCFIIKTMFGEELLRALQIPQDLPGSIVDDLPKVAENFRFTSIQSKNDYAVNGRAFKINWIPHGHQDALIGNGSQDWIRSRQSLHNTEDLGGKGFAEEYELLPVALSWIYDNHSAPLKNDRTVTWIIEAMNDVSEAPPGQPPSLPSWSWEEFEQKFVEWWQQLRENTEDDLDRWWQDQLKKAEDTVNRWLQEQQEKAAEWLLQQYLELLSQCFGSALLPAGALAIMRIYRRKS